MRRWSRCAILPTVWAMAVTGMLLVGAAAYAQDKPGDADAEDAAATEAAEKGGGQPSDQDSEGEAQAGQPQETGRPEARPWRGQDDVKRLMRLREEMRKQIELRDEQVEAINDLFEKHLEAIREQGKGAGSKAEDNSARLRELEERLGEARQSRDRETMRQILGEIRELRGGEAGTAAMHEQFKAAVQAELEEDQARQFDELFRKIMMPGTGLREVMSGLRVLRQALDALDLSPEQKEATRKHLAGAREVLAAANEGDEQAAAGAIADIRKAIVGELNEEQVAQFEAAEREAREELERRSQRRTEMGHGQWGPRHGGRHAPGEMDKGADKAGEAPADEDSEPPASEAEPEAEPAEDEAADTATEAAE